MFYTKNTLGGFLFNFFAGSVTVVLGVFGFGKTFLDMPLKQSIGLGILIYAFIFAFYVIFRIIRSLYQSFKMKYVSIVWGEAIVHRDKAFAEINSIKRKIGDGSLFESVALQSDDPLLEKRPFSGRETLKRC